jgi:uncharacterized protein YlxW (UPF0749 family)
VNNPFAMVVAIVAMAMIASVLRAWIKAGNRPQADPVLEVEKERLLEEVKQLKDRIHVLERITVEKESSLERQIDELRDR